MRHFRRRASIAAVIVLVIASCGGTADSSAEATTTLEAPTTTVAETTTSSSQAPDESTTTTTHATGDDHVEGNDHADVDRTVDIVMTEFSFEPEELEVSAGETIRFVVANEGVVDHEFRLSNAHRIEEHLASGHEDHGDEGSHHEEGGDVLVVVEPGEVGELVVAFPEDTTLYGEVACLLPGHHEAGMSGIIAYSES